MPVVLCHGGPGLWDYLAPVAAALAPVATVHRWEQRGCGRSDRVGPYSLARCIADLEQLRRHFGHDRWLVAGHSWGAGLALRYALAHPDRVLGVLYVSGTGFGQAWRDAHRREASRRLEERAASEEVDRRTLAFVPDVGDPERALAIASAFADVPHPINFACNRALAAEEERTDEAEMLAACRALDVPVRVVHGALDPRPVWAVRSLVDALPRAELVVLDGVGHLPWLEDPSAFADVARDFVTRG